MTEAAAHTVTETTVPRFARGARLQYDRVREVWFIQAPERAFHADPVAAEILQLVDATRTLGAVIDLLAQKFDAPRPVIAQDVLAMVAELTEKQLLLLA